MDKAKVLEYLKLRNDYESNLKQELTLQEQQLIADINKFALENIEFYGIISSMSVMTPEDRLRAVNEYYQKMEEEKLQAASLEEREISKTFGIDVSKIEHKFLKNGNEVFYFYSAKLGRDIVLQNNKNGKSLVEQLGEIQQENPEYQTNNNEQNTNNILNSQVNNSNLELKMVTLSDIKNNPYYLSSLTSMEDKNKLNYLIDNYINLRIKYINLENLIYIDNSNTLREVIYDKEKDQFYTDEPKSASYQDENQNVEVSNASHVEDTQVDYNDNHDVHDEKDINNQTFDDLDDNIKQQVIIYYQYPEILERVEDPEEKKMMEHYVELYKQKLEQDSKVVDKPKVKKKTDDLKKAGFADALILALIAGFAFGVFVTMTALIINIS